MQRVLVSGASIAGLSAAVWLSRHGFEVTVVERAPAPRPGGHAVDLRGVAKVVAERMGVLDEIMRVRVDELGLAYVDERGRRKAVMPVDLFDGEGAVAGVEILRGDLTEVLYRAAHNVDYLFNDSIAHLTEDGQGVHVLFESGAAQPFDLVIGADGLHSNVRRLVFGPSSQFVRHLGAYTAYFTLTDPPPLDGWFQLYNAAGGRLAAIRPEHGANAKAMFSFASPPVRYERHDLGAQKAMLVKKFGDLGWEVPRLLRGLHTAPDFFFDSISKVHLEQWARGRVVLLGDAAFCGSPLSGNGTSMAMVGAYVLAGELASARGDHAAAFTAYQAKMRDYVTECQKLPPGGVNGFLPATGRAIWMRNQAVKVMTSRPMRGLMAKSAQKADSIVLPDYATAPWGLARR